MRPRFPEVFFSPPPFFSVLRQSSVGELLGEFPANFREKDVSCG